VPDLLIIVPTRGRPQNAAAVLDAWYATDAWDHADLVFVVDADDPRRSGYLTLTNHPGYGNKWMLHEEPEWQPMVTKLDKVATRCAGGYFALGFAGDDHLPRTVGWAKRYLDTLHELGTGIVHANDLFQGPNLCTEWAMTSDIVRTLGRMVPAPVDHLCSDSSVHDVGTAAGCLRYLDDVIIEHMHPVARKATYDATYELGNSTQRNILDGGTYRHWRQTQMQADVAKVRALRGNVEA
jgi:hypothetical protein